MINFNARALIDKAHQDPDFISFRNAFLARNLEYWLKNDEMALHYGIGRFFMKEPSAVEIGTYHGASALFVAAGFAARDKGMLYSVDPHMGVPLYMGAAPWQFTLEIFRGHVNALGLGKYITSLVTESVIAAATWPARPISSVLIDADHSYLGCLRDLEFWAPKLVDGGLVLIDDADDPCLIELLELIEHIKQLRGLVYHDTIDGIAIFQRDVQAEANLIDEIRVLLLQNGLRRPYDLGFLQTMKPIDGYDPQSVGEDHGRQAGYQLSFLSRCEPGDYAIGNGIDADDVKIINRLIHARRDGKLLLASDQIPSASSCRLVICRVEDVEMYVKCLKPGGVMLAISQIPLTQENAIKERARLLTSGLESCGWSGRMHWGIAAPHTLSTEGAIAYIDSVMTC
jgi:hypothetical protein